MLLTWAPLTPAPMLKRLDGLIKLGLPKPLYYDPVRANPPLSFTSSQGSSKGKPPKITFPEDRLRARFYRDHPLELDVPVQMTAAVPAVGDDAEWVIQRQLQLLSAPVQPQQQQQPLTTEEAYRRACDELQRRRIEEEIGKRLAGRSSRDGCTEQSAQALFEEVLMEERRVLQLQQQQQQQQPQAGHVQSSRRK